MVLEDTDSMATGHSLTRNRTRTVGQNKLSVTLNDTSNDVHIIITYTQ